LSGHEIVKAAHAGSAPVLTMADPVHGQADDRSPDDGQVHDRIADSDAAAVLTSNHIESEMKAGFNAPVSAVSLEHLLGIHLRGGARAQ